jgi:hypothetical protein
MKRLPKNPIALTHIIILMMSILTGLILSLIISFVFDDFFWQFFKIALLNSTILGLSMLLSLSFTSYVLFRFK